MVFSEKSTIRGKPMSSETLSLTPQLYDYMLENSLREPAVLQALRAETKNQTMAQMQICPEQGQLMRLLIEMLGAKKTLDIGTYTGYSALSVALALPPEGKVYACDVDENWTRVARDFWQQAGVNDKIQLILAPAAETLQKFIDKGESGTFDFAFIDADKANYDEYYEKSLQLIRQGGLIAIDNVLWGGDVADPCINDASTTMFRKLNRKIHGDNRVTMCMVPIGDGLTLARKK